MNLARLIEDIVRQRAEVDKQQSVNSREYQAIQLYEAERKLNESIDLRIRELIFKHTSP